MANLETLGSAFQDTLIIETNREYMDDEKSSRVKSTAIRSVD